MSFFNKHFFVGMFAGAVALVAIAVVAIIALLIVVPKTISLGSGPRVDPDREPAAGTGVPQGGRTDH